MTPEYDEYGVLIKRKLPEVDEYGIAIKKKSGGGVSTSGAGTTTTSTSSGDFPLLYDRKKTASMPALLAGNHPLPEKKVEPISFDIKSVKPALDKAIPMTDEGAQEEAINQIAETVNNRKTDDPLKEIIFEGKDYGQNNYKVFTEKLKLVKNAFPTGTDAKEYLNRTLQIDPFNNDVSNVPTEELMSLAKGNVTKEAAIKRLEDSRNVEQALKGRTLDEASLIYAAAKDPQVKYLLDKAGGVGGFDEQTSAIPLSMRGEKKLQFLMNPDVRELVQSNPELKQEYDNEIANFPGRHPEFATKLLADAIAKRREETGGNNWFANVVGKENTDKIVDELIAEGQFPESYRYLYKQTIRPKLGTAQSIGRGIGNAIPGINQLVNEAPIPTPGVLENFEQGFENFQTGTAKSIANITGIQGKLQPEAQQIWNTLEKEYSTPQLEPTSLAHKTSLHGGNLLGFVAGLVGGTSALNATKLLNPQVAQATSMVLATHGDSNERAKTLFPGEKLKQGVYVGAMDALNGVLGKYLPGQQIPRLLKPSENIIASTLKKMVDGEITTGAAKNVIVDAVSNTVKGSLKGGEFMGAIAGIDDLLTQTLQGKDIDFSQSLDKAWDSFKIGFLATAPLSAMEAGLKSNKPFRNEIISIADNPEYYKQLANREAEINPDFAKIKDEVIENIDYVSKVKQEVAGMKPKEQSNYVINSLAEKVKLTKAEQATDPTIKKRLQKEAKNISEIKDAALKGVPEERVKQNQAIKEVKEFYDLDFLSKGASEMLESVEGEGGKPKFDEGKVKSFLKFVAQQSNNITEDGKFDKESDARKSVASQYPSEMIELANEMFPEYRKTAEEADMATETAPSVIMPEENKPTGEVLTIGQKENVPEAKAGVSVTLPQSNRPPEVVPLKKANETESIESDVKPTEQIPAEEKAGTEGTPPEVKPATEAGQGEEMRLTHADTEKIYQEGGLPERLETPTKHLEQLHNEANAKLEKGYDFNKVAEEVMDGKHKWEDVDQLLFAKKVADLKAKQKEVDVLSPEFDQLQNQIEKLSRASDVAGTETGRALQARKNYVPVEETISDYITREKEAAGVETLTEQQKATTKKEYDEITAAKKAYEEKLQALRDENARLRAEAEVKKAKATAKKDAKKDYTKERAEIFTSIKDKLREARKDTSVTIVPYAKELFAIAPDVAKLVKSYAEQGITELGEIIKNVHGVLKEEIEGITEKDVRDLIAGEYNEKKKTRNELAARMMDLKIEAQLINKLEALERGEEPKSEKKKIERNRQITELRSKIKDFEKRKTAEEQRIKEEHRAKEKEQKAAEKEANKKTPEESALSSMKKRMQSEIDKIEEQLKSGNFAKEEKEDIKLDKEATDLQDRLIKLRQQREERLMKEEYAKSSFWNKAQNEAANLLNAPRTLMASVDYSAPLRQSLFATLSHPVMGAEAFGKMFKASWSEKYYDRWFENLKNSKNYKLMHDSKLAVTDVDHPHLSAREEAYMSNLPHKIPLLGRLVKGSERAYSMYLNKMRSDIFNQYAAEMQRKGMTFEKNSEEFKQMAAFVNNITGRGDLGKTLNEAAPILSGVFFSPRLMASRINTMTYMAQPRFWNKLPRQARIDYFKGLLSTAAIGLSILGVAKAAGAETEDDPRSPDFGKIKVGNTRWDIWGGHQQYIRLAAQLWTNQRKSSTSGNITEMGTGNPYSGSRGELIGGFFRGKLAPVPSLGVDILTGENAIGEKLTTTWKAGPKEIGIGENLATHLLPLVATGMSEAIKDQGNKAFFTVMVPAIFGVGTSTYEPKPASSKSNKKQSKRTTKAN